MFLSGAHSDRDEGVQQMLIRVGGWIRTSRSHRNKMRPWILFVIFGLVCVGAAAGTKGQTGENVDVRSGINHGEFDRLLKKYVNEQGLVNYGAWKQNKADLSALDEYLKQFAPRPDNPAQ